MAIRVLRQELEVARSDHASTLQRSVNQQSTFNSTMSTAIEDIRSEHAETLKDREEQIKVCFFDVFLTLTIFFYQGGYAKKMKELENKIERGQRMLGEKRDEATKQKALHDQAKINADRLEREVRQKIVKKTSKISNLGKKLSENSEFQT